LILRFSVFSGLPGLPARAGAAEAKREPARQRFDPVTTVAWILFLLSHPLAFLNSYF